MTANQYREVAATDVKNELALIALILINRHLILAKEGKHLSDVGDGSVSDGVQLLIGERASLIVLTKLGELVLGAKVCLSRLFDGILHDALLVVHNDLHRYMKQRTAKDRAPLGSLCPSPSSWDAACAPCAPHRP